MVAFPVSGQPPTVIFGGQGATRAADRTPQQRLGMEQRPEAHGQAALATAGRARTAIGRKGMPGWPDIRLGHLFPLRQVALIGIRCAARHPQPGKREIGVSRRPGLRIREAGIRLVGESEFAGGGR
jgi:hypothetical protein